MDKRVTTYKREVWYCLTGMDMLKQIKWFSTKAKAKICYKKQSGNFYDLCFGKLTISSASKIHILEIDG